MDRTPRRKTDCEEALFLVVVILLPMYSLLFTTTVAAGRTWTVDGDGPADYPTIQQAINSANDGDTILVSPGTYYEHLIVDKQISIHGHAPADTVIEGNYSGSVVTVTASNANIAGFAIRDGDEGVILQGNQNSVSGNVLSANSLGVLLKMGSEENVVSDNTILSSSTYGIYGDRCGSNLITSNNISFNGWHGIFLYKSLPCVIDNNTLVSNGFDGMFIRYSSNNTIEDNFVSGNDGGIHIYSDEDPARTQGIAKFNVIKNNVVLNNSCGIKIDHFGAVGKLGENEVYENLLGYNNVGCALNGSGGNLIYHNDFINNSKQVSISASFNNTWFKGYYDGGNYWSDVNGTDLYWGPYQNETGNDGIVDVPYMVSPNPAEEDLYPFMRQDEWLLPTELTVVSPVHGTYRVVTPPLIVAMNKPASVNYSLDGQSNITVVTDSMWVNLSIGIHDLTVYANDTSGNVASSEVRFTITFLGDLSLDGTVNIVDVAMVAYSYGQIIGGERWNPDADLNGDGQVNIIDIAIVGKEFGNSIRQLPGD